jgi:hypothetical protein
MSISNKTLVVYFRYNNLSIIYSTNAQNLKDEGKAHAMKEIQHVLPSGTNKTQEWRFEIHLSVVHIFFQHDICDCGD